MKPASAIKKFVGLPGFNPEMTYLPANVTEIKEFKNVCTSDEWDEFGRQACEAMGVEFDA